MSATDAPAAPATDVTIGVLGPLAATVAGRPVDLRGPRQRAVLAALVVAIPRMVPAEQILADVWPDGDEPGVGTLHYYVSQLRSALEPDRPRAAPPRVLVRRGPGYALQLPPDAVDAVRFARLARRGADELAAGRADEACACLAEALALWRGPAYSDVSDLGFLAPELARLGELQLAAAEDRADALLRAGRAAEAVVAAREHTARHPLRERGWELLALALHRDGRQGDALAALRTARRVLAEELGLDPGPGLLAAEAVAHGSADAAPPVRRPGAVLPANGLPVPLTELVGRDELVAAVAADLAGSRLVTLTGPGGVGKTRVAVAAARDVAERTGEPAHLVELAALDCPSLLPATVGTALGIPGVDDATSLADVLAGRRALLVLDNAEHLLDAVAELAGTLLRRCPELRVLVTSRAALEVAGEQVRPVPPLDPAGAAAELFDRRARAALPAWEPGTADRAATIRVCTELDGLPLALELAAAQLRVLSADQLADALTAARFAVLASGSGGAPEHQRGLERTVDWSYRRLDEAQRQLFRRLAVFADAFDLEGAAAVGAGGRSGSADPFGAALPLLTALVRHSLLVTVPGPGPRRFRMLRTLREFAALRSDGAEQADAALAHRRHVLRHVRTAADALRGPGAAAALDGLRRDRPEHRAAFTTAHAAGTPADGALMLELAGALAWYWYRDGIITEGIHFTRRALAASAAPADEQAALLRSRALHGLGGLAYLSGDAAAAGDALAAAAELAATAGDAEGHAHSRSWLAHTRTFTAPAAEALALAEAAAASAAGAPGWLRAEALMVLGMARRRTGLAPARPVLVEAVDVAEAAGHGWAVVSSTWALMKAAVDDGDTAAALAAAARMRGPLTADGDVTSWLVLVHTTAGVLAGTGRAREAAVLLGAVAALGAEVGFAPERMDPVDGPREAAAVRGALDPAGFARHEAAGRRLGRAEVDALLGELLG